MPYLTLGSNPTILRIVIQSGDDQRPSPVDEDDELIPPPRPGEWAIALIDDDNMHLLAIEEATADDLADFIARLTVQAATAMRAAGVDLAGRIEASLVVAGLWPRGDHDHNSEGTVLPEKGSATTDDLQKG
ncbi:hypothetical protein ACIBQ1_38365 [Nonomuraea sp. NPDC050153]|uniref:hypothetical protein n=1 Tax=Nonomuraea sp. NPDC050153 TaxID=3364359 RepID=UPI003787ADD0